MNLNITVNEAIPTPPPTTPGTFNVHIFYDEVSAGLVSGPFSSRESAEAFMTSAMARPDVKKVTIEEV